MSALTELSEKEERLFILDNKERSFEEGYLAGRKQALLIILQTCISNFGESNKLTREELIAEREEAILTLRQVCKKYGDNAWSDSLNLSDIIEKHLIRYFED